MRLPKLDDLERVRFVWPEPLVIEMIGDHYAGLIDGGRRMIVAKLHERLLRSLVEDDESARTAPALRNQLLTHCRACGLDADVVAKIDRTVFFELIRIVGLRFRNSPRLRNAYGRRLRAVLAKSEARSPDSGYPLPPLPRAIEPPQTIRWRARTAATA